MPPYAISITKDISFRGGRERFSNIYHYDVDNVINTESGWSNMVDQIVALEKVLHSTIVQYKEARVWGPTNQGPTASITRLIKDLSGTGSGNGSGTLYPELCLVGSFYIGRAPATNRKRFLRKYLHVGALAVSPAGSGQVEGKTALQAGDKSPVTTFMNALKELTVGGVQHHLCTPQGDHLPLGATPKVLDYVHVRQFKQ